MIGGARSAMRPPRAVTPCRSSPRSAHGSHGRWGARPRRAGPGDAHRRRAIVPGAARGPAWPRRRGADLGSVLALASRPLVAAVLVGAAETGAASSRRRRTVTSSASRCGRRSATSASGRVVGGVGAPSLAAPLAWAAGRGSSPASRRSSRPRLRGCSPAVGTSSAGGGWSPSRPVSSSTTRRARRHVDDATTTDRVLGLSGPAGRARIRPHRSDAGVGGGDQVGEAATECPGPDLGDAAGRAIHLTALLVSRSRPGAVLEAAAGALTVR